MARISSRGMTARLPQELAARLADFARRLHGLALADLAAPASMSLADLCTQIRVEVISDLTREDFADLLAQVLVYCFLRVRGIQQEQRERESFAQSLRAFLDLPGLPSCVSALLTTLWHRAENCEDELAVCLRDLIAFLGEVDILAVLAKLRPVCFQGNPLIYFYEIFLTAYEPRQRSQRGVYYTPAPVIGYIVRAIDELLRDQFACPAGLVGAFRDERYADGLWLCDPACGTGAFLWTVLDYTRAAYRSEGRAEDWRRDLLSALQPRLSGYEIMPVAYLLACIELAIHQAALDLPVGERPLWAVPSSRFASHLSACLSLTNALTDVPRLPPPSFASLPIILGNPPYAGHSLNHSAWLRHLLESYKIGDVDLKKPAQTKWLSDDYVQFLRLAQWHVEQAGRGIIAFLTSHSYLDNPTFRGLRLSLLSSFDEIYVLDLHGNSKRREQAPDGQRDHNIFPIQQGIALSIFVKRDADVPEKRPARVHYAEVWGEKAVYTTDEQGERRLSGGKLGWLTNHRLSSTPWRTGQPVAPFYLFTPRSEDHQAEYQKGWSLPAIFALNGRPAPGLVTCQDEFAISWTAAEAESKIAAFLATTDEIQARQQFRLCSQSQWNYSVARRALTADTWRTALEPVCYRPFDTRWTIFERHVAVHLRARVTRHMRAGPNLALAVGRAGQVIDGGENWDVAFCTRLPTEFNLFRRGGNYLFPLYLYPATGTMRVANLAPQFIAEISQRLALTWLPDGAGDLLSTFGPDDIFAYIYALFYASSYRQRYADFLKIDFPRIPVPARPDLLRLLCPLGRELSQVHLLEKPLSTPIAWSATDHPRVEHVVYLPDAHGHGRISINAHQQLEGVPVAAWSLTIGGYQVAKKWLWDRRGRCLTAAEIDHYRQIIAALVRTLELETSIDRAIKGLGGWPL